MRKLILGLALAASLVAVGIGWATTGTYNNSGNASNPVAGGRSESNNNYVWSDGYCNNLALGDSTFTQGLSTHYLRPYLAVGQCYPIGGLGGNPRYHVVDINYILFWGSDAMGFHAVIPGTCPQTSHVLLPTAPTCTQRHPSLTFSQSTGGGSTYYFLSQPEVGGSDQWLLCDTPSHPAGSKQQPALALEYSYDIKNESTGQITNTGEIFGGPGGPGAYPNWLLVGQDITTELTCP